MGGSDPFGPVCRDRVPSRSHCAVLRPAALDAAPTTRRRRLRGRHHVHTSRRRLPLRLGRPAHPRRDLVSDGVTARRRREQATDRQETHGELRSIRVPRRRARPACSGGRNVPLTTRRLALARTEPAPGDPARGPRARARRRWARRAIGTSLALRIPGFSASAGGRRRQHDPHAGGIRRRLLGRDCGYSFSRCRPHWIPTPRWNDFAPRRRSAAHLRRRPQHGADSPGEWGTGTKSTVTMTPSQDDMSRARLCQASTGSRSPATTTRASAIAALEDLRLTCAGTFAQNPEPFASWSSDLAARSEPSRARAVEIVDLVWAPAGANVAAIGQVRARAVMHPV